MDQSKFQVVTNWPELTSVKELQHFLAFANLYQHFIWNYNMIAWPLNFLLKGKPKKLPWSESAREAFTKLKISFTTAPILHHPVPETSFIVEVDASSCRIGDVLSQHHPDSGKMHLCIYYSRKLMTAEANYDVGNHELLSIKAALEELGHWLEGAHFWFSLITVTSNTYAEPNASTHARLTGPFSSLVSTSLSRTDPGPRMARLTPSLISRSRRATHSVLTPSSNPLSS